MTSPRNLLVTLDPGLRECGVAIFDHDSGELLAAGMPENDERKARGLAAWARMGHAVARFVFGVIKHLKDIDTALQPFLDRTVEEVDPIERAALRIAAYELRHRIDVPYRVVLNEAIDTTKRFGSEHGHTFVNGVLDHAAAAWRTAEFDAKRK